MQLFPLVILGCLSIFGGSVFGKSIDDRVKSSFIKMLDEEPYTDYDDENDEIIDEGENDEIIDGGRNDEIIDGGENDETINGGKNGEVNKGGRNDEITDGGKNHEMMNGGRNDENIDGGNKDKAIDGGENNYKTEKQDKPQSMDSEIKEKVAGVFLPRQGTNLRKKVFMKAKADEKPKQPNVIEGDILISEYVQKVKSGGTEQVQKRYILNDARYKWTDGKYYYQLSDDLSSGKKSEIRDALAYLGKVSCIEFIEGKDSKGWVLFRRSPHNSCNSYVGRTGGTPQVINVPDWCKEPTLKHEIMHSLGFFHEHNRADRDNFVTIHNENVLDGAKKQFEKYVHPAASYLGKPYDYDSIMHYSRKAFSKNDKDTIVPKDSSARIGGKSSLSKFDKDVLNRYYKCRKCENKGWYCPVTSLFTKCTRSSSCLGSCGFYCRA